jgi:hypothetical protein
MKQCRFFFLSVLIAGLFLQAGASVLSNLASSLTARRWGIMPLNASLGNLSLHYSLLFWNDSGVWDPVKKRVRWVGGPGTCCANPADYKMITYDVEANTWALSSTPFSGSGHAYDANAFNPVLGLHYFALIGDATVRTWNDASWGSLPNAPFSATTPSLTWFPDINSGNGGLVFHGDNGNVAWYDGSSWKTLSSVGLSGYNSFSQYNPAYKGVWLGGCGSSSSWFLDTNLNVRKLADAPISMANGSTMHTCDPVSGNFLVYDHGTDLWYELDMADNTWSQVADMTPKFALNNSFHVPIPEYGVILVFDHASSAKYVYVYKHTAASAVEKSTGQLRETGIRVSPNPFHSSVTLRTPFRAALRIFDTRGALVASFKEQEETVWNAQGLPSGVYLVQANSGGRVFTKKLLFNK